MGDASANSVIKETYVQIWPHCTVVLVDVDDHRRPPATIDDHRRFHRVFVVVFASSASASSMLAATPPGKASLCRGAGRVFRTRAVGERGPLRSASATYSKSECAS